MATDDGNQAVPDQEFNKLNNLVAKLLTETAVSEEERKSYLKETDFLNRMRERDEKFYSRIVKNKEDCVDKLNTHKTKNSEKITDLKVDLTKATVITALITSLVPVIIGCLIAYFLNR